VGRERSVKRHKLETFDAALSEQKPVEWIACCGLRIDCREHMWRIDRQQGEFDRGDECRQVRERNSKRELAKTNFDRDLPQARDAYAHFGFRIRNRIAQVGA
jgi:hypothetical protein